VEPIARLDGEEDEDEGIYDGMNVNPEP